MNLLELAEFAYNNIIQESIQQTPFFPNYDYHQRLDQLNFNFAMNPTAQDVATCLLEIHKKMKTRLIEAQEKQKQNTDKSRKQHSVIQPRDKV